ncbi:MAG: uracil-DNA glycosylase [Bacteriovorax sp.]|jgi:uracil-DNA glycosylase
METLSKNLPDYLLDPSWKKQLQSEFAKPYMHELETKLRFEYSEKNIYPRPSDIFSAFNLTPFDAVKVVIIGQDPYHGPEQAHGLCFSVQPHIKIPPSLANIYKEVESDLGIKLPPHGHLAAWAKQGVLLLNALLTVEDGNPMAHKNLGWDKFTDHVIDLINEKKENVVFILWGSPAHAKAKNVDSKKHFILKSVHPSPLSSYRGFFGCKHFSQCNEFLKSKGIAPINWEL